MAHRVDVEVNMNLGIIIGGRGPFPPATTATIGFPTCPQSLLVSTAAFEPALVGSTKGPTATSGSWSSSRRPGEYALSVRVVNCLGLKRCSLSLAYAGSAWLFRTCKARRGAAHVDIMTRHDTESRCSNHESELELIMGATGASQACL